MDEKGTRKEDLYEEDPRTFEIHPDDVKIISEDEAAEPFEAFEKKVLKGLNILSEIKEAILSGEHQTNASDNH
ncbi:MAG: hypothetical protein ACLFQE_07075 [Thermotogota bacterium]